MTSLPHDILLEISAHWPGHMLRYTCKALYAQFCPDDYVIVAERKLAANNIYITVSRIPNGAYHGKCTNTKQYGGKGNFITETIEYNRGRVVLAAVHNPVRGSYTAIAIINGWTCYWVGRESADDSAGYVRMCTFHRKDVPFRDFIAVASELCAREVTRGPLDKIRILHDWGEPMPGTQY